MMIRMNEGTADRAIRMVVGAVIGGVYATGMLSGVPAGIALAASLVLLLTGITGFCPLYALLRIDTAHPRPREGHR